MSTMLPTIYKRDTLGKIREWTAEVDSYCWRVHTCQQGHTVTTSGWTTCEGKQGRTDEQQALFEANAERNKKLAREYRERLEDVDTKTSCFVKPMLAHKFETYQPHSFSQPKLDGIRCIITADGMWSREGKPIHGAPHIHGAITRAGVFAAFPDIVLDGELYNHDLKDDFNAIVSMVKKQSPSIADLATAQNLVQYHVYDLPSAVRTPFWHRFRALIEEIDIGQVPYIRLVPTIPVVEPGHLDALYASYLEQGYEGQMVRSNGFYEHKRSHCLLKRKEFLDDEFPVVAIEEGNGNWAGYAKRAVLALPDGRTFGAGIRGTQAQMKALLSGPKPQSATIRFFAYTPDKVPRFPVATAFWDGERV